MKRSSVPRCPWHPVLHGPMRLMSAYPTWVCDLCNATTPDPFGKQADKEGT